MDIELNEYNTNIYLKDGSIIRTNMNEEQVINLFELYYDSIIEFLSFNLDNLFIMIPKTDVVLFERTFI